MQHDNSAVTAQPWNLETFVAESGDDCFPKILESDRTNTQSYPEKYKNFKKNLGSAHDQVDYENTLASLTTELINLALEIKDTQKESIPIDNLKEKVIEIYDKVTVLTKHGKGHIEMVIERASDIARHIDEDKKVTEFEAFILLCAIQIHDLGNKYGRDNHTNSFRSEFIEHAKCAFIRSGVQQNCIFNIARAHGGKINGSSDTITEASLVDNRPVDNKDVRQRFLAAILRFADELADDSSRAKEISNMPEYSKIFHAYSKTLHTVRIEKKADTSSHIVKLCYELTIDEALAEYKKIETDSTGVKHIDVPLLKEIFNRIKKMEQERRYCSRYFIPNILLTQIVVEIVILLEGLENYPISFSMEEKGYPSEECILVPDVEEHLRALKKVSEGGDTNEK